jgi:hypothetical protein
MANTNWKSPENEARLRDASLKSKSLAEIARRLGLRACGGNYHTLKFHITRLEIDTSHHLGQHWNRENFRGSGYRNNEGWRKQLIRVRGHKCEKCNLTEWFDKPIPLELEHKDGNRYNYDEENLLLLCCNCHAQTPTWRRRKAL